MVVSINPEPHQEEFNLLLNTTITELNSHALQNPIDVANLTGSKLEPYVGDLMTELAIGTPFENSIECIGGQKFPDIVAKKYYGIEVKTTTKDHWKTTGNSVLESTRVNDVERIYMLFGKLAAPMEFRCRPYENCLSEVVVTHSPRYLIDMNLESGQTIFDKIKAPYDVLRKERNPIKPIVDYYKERLKPGQDVWWMDQDEERASSLIINMWNKLPNSQQLQLIYEGSAYFPEIYSNSGDKYSRFSLWLINAKTVICPNVRDLFSAGSISDYTINGRIYRKVPKAYIRLFNRLPGIISTIVNTPVAELSEHWKESTTERTKIIDWTRMIGYYSKSMKSVDHLDIQEMILSLIPTSLGSR